MASVCVRQVMGSPITVSSLAQGRDRIRTKPPVPVFHPTSSDSGMIVRKPSNPSAHTPMRDRGQVSARQTPTCRPNNAVPTTTDTTAHCVASISTTEGRSISSAIAAVSSGDRTATTCSVSGSSCERRRLQQAQCKETSKTQSVSPKHLAPVGTPRLGQVANLSGIRGVNTDAGGRPIATDTRCTNSGQATPLSSRTRGQQRGSPSVPLQHDRFGTISPRQGHGYPAVPAIARVVATRSGATPPRTSTCVSTPQGQHAGPLLPSSAASATVAAPSPRSDGYRLRSSSAITPRDHLAASIGLPRGQASVPSPVAVSAAAAVSSARAILGNMLKPSSERVSSAAAAAAAASAGVAAAAASAAAAAAAAACSQGAPSGNAAANAAIAAVTAANAARKTNERSTSPARNPLTKILGNADNGAGCSITSLSSPPLLPPATLPLEDASPHATSVAADVKAIMGSFCAPQERTLPVGCAAASPRESLPSSPMKQKRSPTKWLSGEGVGGAGSPRKVCAASSPPVAKQDGGSMAAPSTTSPMSRAGADAEAIRVTAAVALQAAAENSQSCDLPLRSEVAQAKKDFDKLRSKLDEQLAAWSRLETSLALQNLEEQAKRHGKQSPRFCNRSFSSWT
eukprot:TRINITY_DN13874_c0_g1_i2.p1 TRINITY_DN13874_c0_g1~~TRINITY_DN13874_c0_g1_i2.p1  ORF type:complete len:626 (+),score=99.57 TRINITY_DN13874_c0_g1_i2:39-1916(+)